VGGCDTNGGATDRRSAAHESIEHDVVTLGAVEDRVGDERDWLRGGMEIETRAPDAARTAVPEWHDEARDWAGFFGDTCRFRAVETAPSRVSGGKAAESQRLFRRRQETGIVQDCVVGLAGLEIASKRL
jgi:hypothetical protein